MRPIKTVLKMEGTMKVKMFTNEGDAPKLEEEVNKWLSDNPANIFHVKQSYAYDSQGKILYTLISIWYVETI
jgi:hypothetical protein